MTPTGLLKFLVNTPWQPVTGTELRCAHLLLHMQSAVSKENYLYLELSADLAVALLHVAHGDVLLQARAEGATGDLANLHQDRSIL